MSALKIKTILSRFVRSAASLAGKIINPVFKRYPRIMGFLAKVNILLVSITAIKASKKDIERIRAAKDIEGQFGVNIAGYITSESGVGEAARANVRAIEKAGIPHSMINLKSPSRQSDSTFKNFSTHNPYAFNLIQVNADSVGNFFNEKGIEYFRKRYNIGFWYWELSRFPEEWLDRFQFFNEIWVASSFCQETISEVSPVPVVKLPPSVVVDRIKNVDRSYFGIKDDSFVFLFIFDLLSFFERKNPLAVIRAFKEAFGSSEEAQLVLKCSNLEWNAPARDMILEETKGLNVKFIDRYLDKEEVHALMALSDCYVSLHRSEGFGLPLAESMYLGKPVIATAYSSNTDFMNVNNSFPVRYRLVEIEKDYGPYKRGNVWAEPDVEHAAELMRFVYENMGHARRIGEIASEDIKRDFSSEAAGKKILKRLERIVKEKR